MKVIISTPESVLRKLKSGEFYLLVTAHNYRALCAQTWREYCSGWQASGYVNMRSGVWHSDRSEASVLDVPCSSVHIDTEPLIARIPNGSFGNLRHGAFFVPQPGGPLCMKVCINDLRESGYVNLQNNRLYGKPEDLGILVYSVSVRDIMVQVDQPAEVFEG